MNFKSKQRESALIRVTAFNTNRFRVQLKFISTNLRRLTSLLLIFSLLTVSTPAAAETMKDGLASVRQDISLFFILNDWRELFSWNHPEQQETQAMRDASAVRIEIDLNNESFILGKQIPLTAVAYDQNDNPVSGVKFHWQIDSPDGQTEEIIDYTFTPKIPGDYLITTRGAGLAATGKFVVKGLEDWKDAGSGREVNPLVPNFDEWNVDNIHHSRRIKNIRGNPPGKPKGKTNFNIVAPVLSIPGRGLNVDLSLYYNSQVWSKLDQDISYDMDKDWMAPGWTLGYGKIINVINGGIVQVDPDGTRRSYPGSIVGANDRVIYDGQSNDGSFIKSHTETSVTANGQCFYNPTTYLKYPNGTTVWYDVFEYRGCYALSDPIAMVPRLIQDRNGNQIEITYHNPVNNLPGRWINQIIDTLGRTYTFNYTLDAGKYYLTSVTGQGFPDPNNPNTTVTRTFVRLQYKNHTVTHNFSGLTPHVRESNIKVVSAIYYPATQNGYWFGDTDSYSPYGMIRRVDEHRAMSYSAGTGISQGQLSRRRSYSYPADTTTAINDIPAFSTVTESWEGMTTAPTTTEYQIYWDSTPRTSETIAADGSRVKEYSFNYSALNDSDPLKAQDGLTYKTEIYDTAGQLRSNTEIEFEPGYQVYVDVNVPRPKKITQSEIEGSITLTKITTNDFGTSGEYNQVQETKEFGYGGLTDLTRRTVSTYTKKGDNPTTGDDWIMRPRLISLPVEIQTYDAADNRIAYSKNEYDLSAFQPLSGADPTSFCVSTFCNSITDRGNVSKTTTYEDAASLNGPLSDNRTYDKTGNLVSVKPEVTASTLITYSFTASTQYGYPEVIKTGSDNASYPSLFVSSATTFNFNTGLMLDVTDADQQRVEYKYNVDSWRLTTTLLPTGGFSSIDYNDQIGSYTQSAFVSGSTPAGKQVSETNGMGLVTRKKSYVKTVSGQDIWDVVDIEYDQFGRVKRTSNPYRSDQAAYGVYWSEVFYDAIGRPWKTVAPDGSTKFDYYNESPRPQGASTEAGNTFRVKDPIGREKWFRKDIDGNVVEVIEPDPNGNGAVTTNGLVTKYTYDKLKRLTQTEQGSQIRKFKYDSLGRLVSQKMAETSASLNDAGVFVGGGNGVWSDFYTYDKLSNVTSYKDARGVTTTYTYADSSLPAFPIDPFNRLFSISYNTNGAPDVLPSPTVNYGYETTGNFARLKSVSTSGVNTVNLGYDTRGRINQKTTIFTDRPSNPLSITYQYDALSRITDVVYPVQHNAGNTQKQVHYDFDSSGRSNALKVDSVNYASEFDFNNFGQVNSVKIGPTGANQITETYAYNAQTGLLENQKVLKAGAALLDLSYQYQQCSCSTGGSGQVTKIINNLDRNKDRAYEYDALARLKKVTGGLNQTWSQEYTYDRYGNRLGVKALGIEALRGTSDKAASTKAQDKLLDQASKFSSVPQAERLFSDVQNLAKSEPQNTNQSGKTDSQDRQGDEIAKEDTRSPESKEFVEPSTTNLVPNYAPFDFDNDDKADLSVFQRSTGNWVVNQSGNGQTVTTGWGISGDQIAPGDYDGDGKADRAVWRPSTGVWWILQSSNGGVVVVTWGLKGDSIVPADYDGDGKTDVAVWRPSTGVWYILQSSNGNVAIVAFGSAQFGDIPVPGDFDGDAKTDVAVWRPSNGIWYIIQSSNGQVIYPAFGMSGDVPVQARYDGDNKDDLAVWRPSTGVWYVMQSSTGNVVGGTWGGLQFGDVPVPADYDGDNRTDYAIWRQPSATWYILRSSDGGVTISQLGASGDIAVPSAFRRRSSAPTKQNQPIPRDGIETVTYDNATNRITNTGFTYDLAGNQTRVVEANGTPLRYQYDAAGRLVKVKDDNYQTLTTYTYAESRRRLIAQEGNESSTNLTYYAWEGDTVIAEFTAAANNTLIWAKNYLYMGGALLATHTKITGGERLEFAHSDRLGTRLVTNPNDGTSFEQATLPFGTVLESESTGSINRRFTSYDRSVSTGLDYAVNRFYNSSQGRFTSVDPIKFNASNLMNPQTLNLYSYTANDPINRVDPDGKSWGFIGAILGAIFSFIRHTNFRFNFTYKGIPFSFGFQGHFKNIYVGVAGFNVQVTGQSSVFNLFKKQGFSVSNFFLGGDDPRSTFTSCLDFANYLHNVATGKTADIGKRLFGERNGDFSNSATIGFLPGLIANGQGIGVYRHVIANAGAYQITGGSLASYGQEATDIVQQYYPSWLPGGNSQRQQEAVAERAGNAAGWAIGGFMATFFASKKGTKDYQNLYSGIKNTICEGKGY
jgi:RHS repeat-associated protein